MALPKPAGLKLNGNSLTDHSRSPIDISFVAIEYSQRMWNGTRRKRHVATKATIRATWDMLPNTDVDTVDGNWGFDSMKSFYDSNKGVVTATITFADGTTQDYSVMIEDFSSQLMKRGRYDLYSASIVLEEV